MAKKVYNRVRGDSGQRRRILAIMLVLGILGFVPLSVRLVKLMVVDGDYYTDQALKNQTRTTPVTGHRGVIYDCNMNILACSVTVENVYLDPNELKQSRADLNKISQDLAQILELDADWVYAQAKDTRLRYKKIASRLDAERASAVRAYINTNGISGIHLEPDTQRQYPYGTLASQVIGFTNASSDGSEGLEAAYNSVLKGGTGKVITTKGNNEMDMPYSYEAYLEAGEGNSLVLTLDTVVQSVLEENMRRAIEQYDVQNGAFGMVMDVNTGAILAMATLEGYDPNAYTQILDPDAVQQLQALEEKYKSLPEGSAEYTQAKQQWQQAKTAAQLKQWRNRCISDGYEPGSTFKVMTMAAALDCGAIDLQTDFHCGGAEKIPGRSQLLHCWRSTGHGSQKTANALQNSCNLAFAHIALRLGGQRFYDYVKAFGILEKTGIDLAGESKGVFFSPELVINTDKWGTASLTSGSFGQTFKLTPIQLVRGISAVVNGGKLLEPYLVQQVLDPEGNVLMEHETKVLRQVIRPETSATMCQLLESVVAEGTAKNAAVAGYQIGGKTGTSEKIDVLDANGQPTLDKIVSFVGVAPMDNPQYIILVALDTPSRKTGIYISGGVMAAPTVGGVFNQLLPYWSVEKAREEPAVTVPDLTGKTQAEIKTILKELGLGYIAKGQAEFVTGQIPGPGENVIKDSQLLVYFGRSPEQETVTVPDFSGMTRQQASLAAGELGLCIRITGNSQVSPQVVVTQQSHPAGISVPMGTTITLQFTNVQIKE